MITSTFNFILRKSETKSAVHMLKGKKIERKQAELSTSKLFLFKEIKAKKIQNMLQCTLNLTKHNSKEKKYKKEPTVSYSVL